MHDGLYGRSHLYSYVNDNGTWWKTVDWAVTEASRHRCPILKPDIHVFCIGFGGDRSNGPDRLPPRRRALHAHLQPRRSGRGPTSPPMARGRRGTCTTPAFLLSVCV